MNGKKHCKREQLPESTDCTKMKQAQDRKVTSGLGKLLQFYAYEYIRSLNSLFKTEMVDIFCNLTNNVDLRIEFMVECHSSPYVHDTTILFICIYVCTIQCYAVSQPCLLVRHLTILYRVCSRSLFLYIHVHFQLIYYMHLYRYIFTSNGCVLFTM